MELTYWPTQNSWKKKIFFNLPITLEAAKELEVEEGSLELIHSDRTQRLLQKISCEANIFWLKASKQMWFLECNDYYAFSHPWQHT